MGNKDLQYTDYRSKRNDAEFSRVTRPRIVWKVARFVEVTADKSFNNETKHRLPWQYLALCKEDFSVVAGTCSIPETRGRSSVRTTATNLTTSSSVVIPVAVHSPIRFLLRTKTGHSRWKRRTTAFPFRKIRSRMLPCTPMYSQSGSLWRLVR